MNDPLIVSSFEYRGRTIAVEWYDLLGKPLPDLPWQQVYAIANIDGRIPVVHYADENANLPGGKTEPGEDVDTTIRRELLEELNCDVVSWEPLGYQRLTDLEGNVANQLRVLATLTVRGPFVHDPGGSVVGYSLIELGDLNSTIRYGDVGEHMQTIVSQSGYIT